MYDVIRTLVWDCCWLYLRTYVDKNILDNLEDEHEFEAIMIVESEEIQSTLSQRIALINHKLTALLQQITRESNSVIPHSLHQLPQTQAPPHTAQKPLTMTVQRNHLNLPVQRQVIFSNHLCVWHNYLSWKSPSIVVIPWTGSHFGIVLSLPSTSTQTFQEYRNWATNLRAQREGESARVITGLPLTNTNYTHSVDLLKKVVVDRQTN